jgi:uncharacterized membrane protein YhaH (DUF805 family)
VHRQSGGRHRHGFSRHRYLRRSAHRLAAIRRRNRRAVGGIVYIAVIISGIAVGIKRLHDRDKSGWWLLVFYLGPSVLSGLGASTGFQVGFGIASFALALWAFVELGCLRGTAGANQYGPDPLAR